MSDNFIGETKAEAELLVMANAAKGDALFKSGSNVFRLAINAKDWTPNEAQWLKAFNLVQVNPKKVFVLTRLS